jgi:hypothetical protein
METIPPPNLVAILKYSFISGFLVVWSVTITKISVACMLLRLQQGKTWYMTMSTAIFVLLVITLVFTGFSFSLCRPLRAGWDFVLDPSLMDKCMGRHESWVASLSTSGINRPMLPFTTTC